MKALVLLLLLGCGRGPAPCMPKADDAERGGERRCEVRK